MSEDSAEKLQQIEDEAIARASQSRISLLSRQHPEGYLEEWSQRLQQPPAKEVVDTIPVLIFRIGKEWLGINVHNIAGITSVSNVHKVPHRTNKILLGLANVGGELEICISLSALLGLHVDDAINASEYQHAYPRMLVMSRESERYVSKVSEVFGVLHFETDLMEAPPVTVTHALSTYSQGIFMHKRFKVALLDDELIYHSIHSKNL